MAELTPQQQALEVLHGLYRADVDTSRYVSTGELRPIAADLDYAWQNVHRGLLELCREDLLECNSFTDGMGHTTLMGIQATAATRDHLREHVETGVMRRGVQRVAKATGRETGKGLSRGWQTVVAAIVVAVAGALLARCFGVDLPV